MYIEYRMILHHKTIGIENEKVLQDMDMDLKNPVLAIVARENQKTIKRVKGKGVCEGFMFRV